MWTVLGHGEVGPNPQGNPSSFDRSRSIWWAVGVVVAVGNCCGQSCLRQHMEKPLALVLVDVTMGEREFGQHSETGLWGTRGFEAVNDGGSREGSRRLWRVLFSLWRRVRLRISFQMEKGAWRSNFLMLQTHQATRGKAARQTSRSRSVDYSYESPTRDRHYNINCVVCAGTWFWWRKLLELCVRGSLMNGPYRAPHPDSEVNSLWSMEQWDQGKSAKSMRNFGRSIGSKGWTRAGPMAGAARPRWSDRDVFSRFSAIRATGLWGCEGRGVWLGWSSVRLWLVSDSGGAGSLSREALVRSLTELVTNS